MAKQNGIKTITKFKAFEYWQMLSYVRMAKLNVKDMLTLSDLRNELDKQRKNIHELRQNIFDGYGLKPDPQGNYFFKGHDKEKEIQEKLEELNNTEVEVTPTNFLDKDTFVKALGYDDEGEDKEEKPNIHIFSELRGLLCKE